MVYVQLFTFNAFQENTYVVYNAQNEAMIVDPGCSNGKEEKVLADFIQDNGLDVQYIVCTHCHIDHVMGLQWAADYFGKTPLVPKGEIPVLQTAARVAELYGLPYNGTPEVDFLPEGSFALGDVLFKMLDVPGHSPAHVAFYHEASGVLLAGDVLFHRSIGRTDLPGGDHATLLNSIRTELFTLPDETKVWPGHMQPTTIGEEKRYNPFLN